MNDAIVFFYGRLAGFSRKDAERVARDAGYRVASSLFNAPSIVVLGEGESLAQSRARLATEFDAESRDAFERGALEILAESAFFRRVADLRTSGERESSNDETPLFDALKSSTTTEPKKDEKAYTPAAVAELSGVSILAIRRWHKRGFLTPNRHENARLPVFSSREVLVAKRLAFLCFAGLTDDFIVKRLTSFKRFSDSPQDVGSILLKTTTSTDGRELLFLRGDEPIDWRGQRRFDFAALPTDGSFEKPSAPPRLSPDEEQIELAESLAVWNADATDESGRPAFLSLFQGSGASDEETTRSDAFKATLESNAPSVILSNESRAFWRQETKRSVVDICEEAWKLERDGYWEEAARVYRSATFVGGLEPGVCFRLGKVLFLLGDYAAARERFYTTLELDDNFVDARIELGKTFVALNELDDALVAFQGALKDKPDDPILLVETGKLYLQLGVKEAAQKAFRAAVEKIDDPKLAEDVERILLALTLQK